MSAHPLVEVEQIAFAGDWHANKNWAVRAVHEAADMGAQVILHTGDFGYYFSQTFLQPLDAALARHQMPLLFVDGNHENFNRLYGDFVIGDNGLRQLTDWTWHLPRGFRWEWGGVKFLALGGAHSVDRPDREPNVSWWFDETISPREERLAIDGGAADVLLSHDCPINVRVPGLDKTAHLWQPAELEQAHAHQQLMQRVADAVQPALIFHGHYHRFYHKAVDFGYGTIQAVGLDCDGSNLHHNLAVTDLSTMQQYINYCRTGGDYPQCKLF